ncbi:MAG: hypothetical protein ACTSRG_24505 [Candidatus Helarchaeota archaeon]
MNGIIWGIKDKLVLSLLKDSLNIILIEKNKIQHQENPIRVLRLLIENIYEYSSNLQNILMKIEFKPDNKSMETIYYNFQRLIDLYHMFNIIFKRILDSIRYSDQNLEEEIKKLFGIKNNFEEIIKKIENEFLNFEEKSIIIFHIDFIKVNKYKKDIYNFYELEIISEEKLLLKNQKHLSIIIDYGAMIKNNLKILKDKLLKMISVATRPQWK